MRAAEIGSLPEPCLRHLEARLRRPQRVPRLTEGCRRISALSDQLFLDGLRLFPHALSRAAEAIGPLPAPDWEQLSQRLLHHRLWQVAFDREADFWSAVAVLEPHRELPQPILDFQETGRPREQAPLDRFQTSLHRFLVRAKLEKIRFEAYAATRSLR